MVPAIKLPACTSVCTVKSVVTDIVYSWVVATGTGVGKPFPACFPELLSHIRGAIIMMPLLAGTALYRFTLSMRLPAQTIYRYHSTESSTDLLPLHPWGSCVWGGGKFASFPPDSISGGVASSTADCIVFDEGLGGNTVLCCLQWQRMHNQQSHTATAH